ncbi:MAG: phage tail tape measure protein [Acutalibacteraceae bacterium]
MANNKIQGITVEIGGDSTPISKAIDSANQKSKLLQSELRGINTLMKGDPNSAVLLSQKQEILNKSVEETRAKLQMLKSKQEEVTQAFRKNEITEEQYRNFQREIEKTEQDLVNLRTNQLECASVKFDNAINSTKKFGESLTTIGNKLKMISTVATGLIALSVKNASEYETSVAKVSTLTDKQVLSNQNLSKGILQISNDLGKANTDIAEATYQALSASVDTGNALEFTANAAKLAKAGFTETATAVDILTTIENAYNISADKTNTLADMLVNTQNKGKTTVGQLAETMGRVIPTAETLNVSIGQLCTGYAEMTKRGINTANATTYMNSLFDEFGKSSTDLYEITQKVAGKSFKDLMKEGKSLGDVIQMLADYAEKNNKNFNDFFGKSNSRKAALSILKVGADGFNKSLQQMENCTGTVDQALEDLQTPTAKAKKAINQLKNTSVEFGSQIISDVSPMIEDIGDKIKDLSEWWDGLNDSQKESAVKIAAIVAVGAPALTLLGKATTGISTLTSNLKTAIISIVAKTTATEADTAATTTATVATGALSVAMKALPLIAIAGLVVTVTSELVNLCSSTDDATSKNQRLAEEIKNTSEEFENYKKSVEETMNQDLSQIEVTQNLADELETLVDKNGKVKKGYEKRVDFINNELNEALGLELKRTGKIEDGYEKIGKSIDKLIQKKRAQIILNSQSDVATEAEKEKSKVEKEYTDAVDATLSAEKALNDFRKQKAKIDNDCVAAQQKLNEAQKSNDADKIINAQNEYNNALAKQAEFLRENENTEKNLENALKSAQRTESDALKNKKDNYNARQQYANNYEEFLKGHYKKIINNSSTNEKIIADISKASQEEIKDAYEKTCERIKHFQEEKKKATTSSEKQMWQDLINKTKTERDEYKNKLDSFSENTGKSAMKSTTKGINKNKGVVGTAYKGVVNNATNLAFSDSVTDRASRGGNLVATKLASGIKQYNISPATNRLINGIWQTIHSENTKSGMNSLGYFLTSGVATGAISASALSLIKNAGKQVYTTYKSSLEGESGIASPAKKMMPDGAYLVLGVVKGAENEISKQIPNLKNKARQLMNVFSSEVPDEYYSTNLGTKFHAAVEHTFSNLQMQSTAQTVEALSSDVAKIGKQLDQLIDKAQKNIVLDGKTLVGATVSETDKQLGNRQDLSSRGLPT